MASLRPPRTCFAAAIVLGTALLGASCKNKSEVTSKNQSHASASAAIPILKPGASPQIVAGATAYLKYCALCHGVDARGYAADNAPSLISQTFLESANDGFLLRSIREGRQGTAMAGYARQFGGPLEDKDIQAIMAYLRSQGPALARLVPHQAGGDTNHGMAVYERECVKCHGTRSQRGFAVQLWNSNFLAAASDEYLRHAITMGRPGTPMPSFVGSLDSSELTDVIALLRSWGSPPPSRPAIQHPEVPKGPVLINPSGGKPSFTLRDDRYVPAEQVKKALDAKKRLVIIDARATSDWYQSHIPGSISVPYYGFSRLDDVPNDSNTWVLAYCACPHHASGVVVEELRRRGYKNTAVIDEGILEWQKRKYPIESTPMPAASASPASSLPQPILRLLPKLIARMAQRATKIAAALLLSRAGTGTYAAAAMTTAYLEHLRRELDALREAGLFKSEREISTEQGAVIRVGDGPEVLNFCANNYLGLSSHPEVIKAAHEGLERWGYGMSSVRFICGTQQVHKTLEQRLSSFLGTEDTILYSSCFDANGGLFETLFGEQDAIISDALNHASIIDGIRLCKAQRLRYANNDMADLERQLDAAKDARFKLIATDGVFSMDGYIANLKAVCDLAERHGAMVMVDDSHAVGFIGEKGRGTHEHNGVMGRIDLLTGTLGKALGGASGGYISGRKEIIAWLRQRSRPYLFSNTLSPSITAASLRVLDLLESSSELRDRLRANAAQFRAGMTAAGFRLLPGEHPIIPVMLGDAKLASAMADRLLNEGIYVIGFSFPVVPKDQARIRVQISAGHRPEHIDQAVAAFTKVGRELGVIGGTP